MKPDDRKRFITTLVGVYGFFDRELSEFSIRIWSEALADEAINDIENAFSRHLKDPSAGRFLPRPADILRQLHGDDEDKAQIAWGDVLASARRGGGYWPDCDAATRQAVEALGGWSVVCRSDENNNGFLQRRFLEAFKAYKHREDAPEALRGIVRELLR